MRPIILICATQYVIAMVGVSFAARQVVGGFGVVGGLVTIGVMYAAARYSER